MANKLLADRDALPVGKRWASNFVKRQSDLKTRRFRRYDYKRAKCEDPEVIRAWFTLVENKIAKYGIDASDIYNFDETGFMMGVISTGMVVTSAERGSSAKLAQPGNREWVTTAATPNNLVSKAHLEGPRPRAIPSTVHTGADFELRQRKRPTVRTAQSQPIRAL